MRIAILVLGLWACGKGDHAAYVVGSAVCVDGADTVDSAPQPASKDALPGCKTWPRYELVKPQVEGLCGPCGFTFDRATTMSQRARSPDACCYSINSPPPPPPPGP